jgi:HK97 gp10 family phage protein
MSVKLNIVKNDLPKIPQHLRQAVADALTKAAHVHESLAKQLAPVDTGNLRNSIQVETEANESALKSEVQVNAEYGIYVELGTVHQSSQPFFSPAFEAAAADLKNDLMNVLK